MFVIVKGKEIIETENRQLLNIYLANGWTLQKKVTSEVVKQVQQAANTLADFTKKQLQDKLAKKEIKFTPQENKADLISKLENSDPADDFNDGLLKG
jgi:hypothetical protein